MRERALARSLAGSMHSALRFALPAFLAAAVGATARAQTPTPDEIQQRREDMERKKIEYREEKARVDDLNARVEQYKHLRESVPFTNVQGTSNLVQVYVNRHDVRDVARQLYFLTNDASEAGFERDYWRPFLTLNQAGKYPNGMPQYGAFDPTHPEENVAVFPNIRKRELSAVVAEITTADTAFAMQMTAPVLAAFERRQRERVITQVSEVGVPPDPTGPAQMPGENTLPLLAAGAKAPLDSFPPRKITDETSLAAAGRVAREPVPVNHAVALDPAPPSWALGQEITMLGAGYSGYDATYQPGDFELMPEGGAMAFFGGRDPLGNPRTQPGVYFSFNQKVWHLLALSEMAFAAFEAGDAKSVNGGSLNAGIDYEVGAFGGTALVGYAAFNTVGETETGVCFTGKLRYALAPRVYVGAIYTISDVEIFQTESNGVQRSGITNPGFAGISLTVR